MPSWQEYPLLRIFIAYMAGILLISEIQAGLSLCYILIGLGLFCLALGQWVFKRKDLIALSNGVFIVLFFVSAGAYFYFQKDQVISEGHFSRLISNEEQFLLCKLKDSPSVSKSTKVTVNVEAIGSREDMKKSHGLLLLYLKSVDSITYSAGDIILVNSTITPTPSNTNPYAFDFKAFLHNRGIDYQSFVNTKQHILFRRKQLNKLEQWSKDTKVRLLEVFDLYLPEGNEKAVVLAMLLGYRNNLTHELYTSYTDTGIVHVLAVSGLHVGIIASLLMFILKWIPEKIKIIRLIKTGTIILCICFYALITGSAPAVVRATIMFSLILINWYFDEKSNLFNSLALAALAMLMYDPRMLFQASFQFSFLALSSIVYFHPKLLAIWRPDNKFLDILYQFILVSIAAQLLVFPFTIYYFHKFPSYFILSSLFAVPAAYIIIYGGIFIQLLHFIGLQNCIDEVSFILLLFIKAFNYLIALIQQLPGSVIDGIWAEKSTMMYLFFSVLSIMGFISFNYNKSYLKLTVILLFCCITGSSFRYYYSQEKSIVNIYDIHKGYALDFIQGRNIYTLMDSTISHQKSFFAVNNNRIKYGGDHVIPLDDDLTIDHPRIKGEANFIQFKKSIFYITPNWFPKPSSGCIPVDYLIVTRGCKAPPYLILDYVRPKAIICDKSIYPYQVKKWKSTSVLYNIPIQSIYDSGAVTLTIKS